MFYINRNVRIVGVVLFSLFLQCEPRLENNLRIIVSGSVKDANANALEGVSVNIFTSVSSSSSLFFPSVSGTDNYSIGSGFTDADGNFSVISAFDRTSNFFITLEAQEGFSKYTYATSTLDYRPDDLLFDLQEIVLRPLAKFNFSINRTSTNSDIIQFSFEYNNPDCFQRFEEGVLVPEESLCNFPIFFNRLLNNSMPDINGSLDVELGTEVIFTYAVNGGIEVTENVIIDSADFNFNFSY